MKDYLFENVSLILKVHPMEELMSVKLCWKLDGTFHVCILGGTLHFYSRRIAVPKRL